MQVGFYILDSNLTRCYVFDLVNFKPPSRKPIRTPRSWYMYHIVPFAEYPIIYNVVLEFTPFTSSDEQVSFVIRHVGSQVLARESAESSRKFSYFPKAFGRFREDTVNFLSHFPNCNVLKKILRNSTHQYFFQFAKHSQQFELNMSSPDREELSKIEIDMAFGLTGQDVRPLTNIKHTFDHRCSGRRVFRLPSET